MDNSPAGPSDVLAALPNWETDDTPLLGIAETRELEFKRVAYRLGDPLDKLEFAKDVSGMANAGGGLIVLGIDTERNAATAQDVTTKVLPIAAAMINVKQMQDVARDWIYPPQRGLGIRVWWNAAGDQGLVAIAVPAFMEIGGLALVRGADIDDSVVRRPFGVAIRSDAQVEFYTHTEVYDWIRRGRLSEATASPTDTRDAGQTASSITDLAAVADELERARAVDDEWPVFVLQAWPHQVARLDRIHDRDGVRGVFADPPTLRPDRGFNFAWLGHVQTEPDGRGGLRASAGGRQSLWVTRDGIITFAGTGGPDLLAWAMHSHSSGLMVNPLVLAELTYEFVCLWKRVARFLDPQPGRMNYRAAFLESFRQSHLFLGGGRTLRTSIVAAYPVREAPASDVVVDVAFDAGAAPEEVAGRLLRDIYGEFALGSEEIPFLDNAREQFDPERFLEFAGT